MLKNLFVVSFIAALSGCGGGGSSTPTTVTPATASSVIFQPNDSLTYSFTATPTGTTTGSASARLETRTVTAVNADSSYSRIITESNGDPFTSQTFNASGQETAYQNGAVSCTNLPLATFPSAPYVAGQVWKHTYSRTCVTGTTSSQATYVSTGTVVGTESITTDAGTFSSYKLVYTDVGTDAKGVSTTSYTCWRSVELDRTVLCNYSASYLPINTTTPINTTDRVQKLIGVSVARYSGSKPIVARFAGNYALTFVAASTCTNFSITASGNISSSCQTSSPPFISTTLTGNVDVNGNVQATVSNGTTFIGKFSSPVFASGTLTYLTNSGPWNLAHY